MTTKNTDSKNCEKCGRTIEFRRRYKSSWDQVKYCSERCRRARKSPDDEEAILSLLSQRAAGATICPSEILPPEEKQDKARMEEVRQAARRLANAGKIEITQKKRVVDPSEFRGPIRLRSRS